MEQVEKLGSWGELYVMLGTSSAALIGLLFVAASLHLREIVSDAIYKIRAQDTMLLLVATLVQAAAILTPQPEFWLGAELLLVNLWCLWIPITLLVKAFGTASRRRGGFSPYRATFFVGTYAVGVAGSIALIARLGWGIHLVTVAYIGGLLATIWNAWNIMLGIGQAERQTRTPKQSKE
jgi:hypothetical protein